MSTHVGGFVELLGRSAFSFLEASSMPEELVEAAHGLGLGAIALCDRDGIYGLPRAYAQGKKLGMPVIVGAELTLEGPWPDGEEPGRDAPPGDPPTTLALLAEDHAGYGNLCKHLTTSHADHEKGEAGITLAEVAADTAGLSALVPLADAWVARAEHAADLDALLGPVREAFGERAAVATWRRFDGLDRRREALAHAVSQRFDLPVVASARPRFHHPSRKPLADVMFCIKHKTTLDAAGTILAANAEAGLRTPDQMRALFRDRPEWLRASLSIADRCRFSLGQLRYAFPSDTLCLPGESADQALRRLTEDGCRTRYPGGVPPAVRAQIEKELALIAQLGVAPYFMSVRQVVEMARARRILCQGRGSAANSAVCFALGITAVDPARSNLLFERFLSAERAEPPDIDVDFEHERREEVIQDIYATYGRDRSAMVSTLICYRGKSALREVGKVFGLSVDQVDRLSGLVMHYEFEGNPERIAETGLDPDDPRLRRVVMMAGALEGFPRHLSIHVGGFVLSSQPLHLVAPIEPARMEGRTVIPWDKDDIDDLGFFKVDVLGLGMLTAIRKCLAMVHARKAEVAKARGEQVPAFDPIEALAAVPPEVPAVYDAVCRADTIGVFQIESRAQMAMLPRLRPRKFYDLVIEVAIVRPGPIQGGMVHPYLRRRTGKEEVTTPHPCLDSILHRTLGVPLFQEQVMQIAMTGAGYTAGEADQLRRDMAAWKRHGRLERHRARLLEGFSARGISASFAEQIYQQVQGFGEYGFPECVVGETLVLDATTGRRVRIDDVVAGRAQLTTTLACDSKLRIRKRRVVAATPSGRRRVYRIRTALGRELIATPEHPLLTERGWRPLASLGPGDHVAAARLLPQLGTKHWPRHEIVVLADLVAEGNMCHPTTFYFYSQHSGHKDEFVRMVERFPNTRATVAIHHGCFSVHVRRAERKLPCGALAWAERFGLRQIGAHDKMLPAEVFELAAMDVALLLARLWEGDGHLSPSRHASYDTASRTLAEQVQHLLLRLGIVSRVYERARPYAGATFVGYTVTVTGADNLRSFFTHVARRFLDPVKRTRAKRLAGLVVQARMSRDVVPSSVRERMRRARDSKALSWVDIGRATGLGMREIQARGGNKGGFRRWVVEKLGRYLGSPELVSLGTSDLYWDRVVSLERLGFRETFDLTIEHDANFVANDFIVHNSHAASFALLVYVSSFQKVFHPAAFACALLNAQPMGFYSPSSIVRDVQAHGVTVRPVCVLASEWDNLLEYDDDASGARALPGVAGAAAPSALDGGEGSHGVVGQEQVPSQSLDGEGQPVIRLGMRQVKGLPEAAAQAIVAARRASAFGSLADLVQRTGLKKNEVEALAEAGALAALVPERREALWRARAPRAPGLFEGLPMEDDRDVGLEPLGPVEQLILDYGRTGMSLEDHPMNHIRPRITAPRAGRRERIHTARDLLRTSNGRNVVVAGLVIGRQRPATASGVTFITLEDETGVINLVVHKRIFTEQYLVARHAKIVLVRGRVEREGDVIHVLVRKMERLDLPSDEPLPVRSRDFH